nr:MAG: N-acetylmuramoyl-L-alanine amidase [Bacteriophage sp.]
MSNSPLATYTRITKNKTSPRNHTIDTITIHCIVGQWTAKQGCDYFATTDRQCSANYVVGKDGSIGLSVDEKDRSWCSSNGTNDNRAITIEVASDTTHPYAVTAKAYAALLDLVTDICKRNGIKKLVWSTNKNDRVNHRNGCNMTVHRDFANKACPGEYLYSRHGEIAAEVNRRLQGASNGGGVVVTPPAAEKPTGGTTGATVTPYLVRVKIANLNIRKGPGTNYGATGYIRPGIYTIVAESTGKGAAKWGKLKSGAGWISLDYATKT